MINVQINDRLFQELLRRLPEEADKAMASSDVRDLALRTIRELTPVGKSGTLQKGWVIVPRGNKEFELLNKTGYAAVVDEGWFRGVGPKTVYSGHGPGHGIFSTQAPFGMIEPFLEGLTTAKTTVAESVSSATSVMGAPSGSMIVKIMQTIWSAVQRGLSFLGFGK